MTLHHTDRGSGRPAPAFPRKDYLAYLISKPKVANRFVADLAHALIEAKDAIDPDPDLEDSGDTEPNCGGMYTSASNDECEDVSEDGCIIEDGFSKGEATLGWCENVSQLGLGANCDDGDSTAPERHGLGFRRCSPDDVEDVSEDEGACIQSQCHDPEPAEVNLGSCDRHMDQRVAWAPTVDCNWDEAELDRSDFEPSLGSLDGHVSQTGWSHGGRLDLEEQNEDADPLDAGEWDPAEESGIADIDGVAEQWGVNVAGFALV